MIRICPNPMPWNEAYKRLTRFAEAHSCVPPKPPMPLILNGWVYSNDNEKKNRWNETVQWAEENRCIELVDCIQDKDFYFVDEPSTYQIGPMGGPMYRQWDFQTKHKFNSTNQQVHPEEQILIPRLSQHRWVPSQSEQSEISLLQ